MTQGHAPLLEATSRRGLDGFALRRTTASYHVGASDSGESGCNFGVVQVGANQFKVFPDDLIFVEKLPGYNVNDKVRVVSFLSPLILFVSRSSDSYQIYIASKNWRHNFLQENLPSRACFLCAQIILPHVLLLSSKYAVKPTLALQHTLLDLSDAVGNPGGHLHTNVYLFCAKLLPGRAP